MAYNNKNLLIKIIEIQGITMLHKANGATQKWIFENKIKEIHHVSERTFKNYLGRNAKYELKELERKEV